MGKILKIVVAVIIAALVITFVSYKVITGFNAKKIRQEVSQNFDSVNFLINGKSTGISKISRSSVSGNYMTREVQSYLGKETIFFLEANEDSEVTFDYTLKVNEGKLRIYYLGDNNEYIEIANGTSNGTKTIKVKKGKAQLMMVGLDADFNMSIKFEEHPKVSIKTKSKAKEKYNGIGFSN